MAEIKDYIWGFPLVGGILAFVTLAVPAVSMNFLGMGFGNLWFWALYNYNAVMISGTDFITELMVLIPSMIVTGIIALSGILLLISSIKLKKRSYDLRNVKNLSLLAGLLILITEILWLVMVPIFFPMAYYWDAFLTFMLGGGFSYNFWSVIVGFISFSLHNVGFGVIIGFISTGISLGGAGAANYYSKERPEKLREKKEPKPPIDREVPSETPALTFCPECGAEIEDPSIKFCGKCGFKLTGVPMTKIP